MADNIIMFHKSREQRLEELNDVLNSRDSPVLASQIADEWSCSLENFIEPTGWQALWKISRLICEELKITFPKFVFVKVRKVDFDEMTAFVDVEKVQDDIDIPPQQEVPLTQLYPTVSQENPHLNIDYTANFIDQLRFFYYHLWCPWDIEDTEGGDWPSEHLQPRLQLFYEMNDGTIPVKLADKIHKVKEQALKLFEQKQALEEMLHKGATDEVTAEDILSPSAEDQTYKLVQVHLQLRPLITELQLFENPSMRKIITKRFLEDTKENHNSNAVVVWQGGLVDKFIDFLSHCKNVINATTCTVSASSFPQSVESAVSGNTILLCEGLHYTTQIFEFDLAVIGVGSISPEIAAKESHSFLFSVRNANVTLKNLKLHARNVSNALQILKNSTVELINCTISNEDKVDGRGVVVNRGASVVLNGCTLSSLHVGVCCHPESQVQMTDCTLEDCAYGIEAYENSRLKIWGGSITNCKEAGLFIIPMTGPPERGDIELLERFQKISVSQLLLEGNSHNVVLNTDLKL